MSEYLEKRQYIEEQRRLRKGKLKEAIIPYLFVSPFLISFLIFMVFPSIYTIILSLTEYSGYGDRASGGFLNYQRLLTYPNFWMAVQNTLIYYIGSTVPVMIAAFFLAVALYSKLVKWKNFYKIAIFLPQVMAIVAASLVWRVIFSTETGVINTFFGNKIPWLSDPFLMKLSVIIMLTWRATGWFFVVFLAGLTSIPADIYEAAEIDGANFGKRIWLITLPLLRPIILFAFVINTISTLKLYTEPNILVKTPGDLALSVHAIPLLNLLTDNLQSGFFGLAAAVGWILFVVIALLSFAQFELFNWG